MVADAMAENNNDISQHWNEIFYLRCVMTEAQID